MSSIRGSTYCYIMLPKRVSALGHYQPFILHSGERLVSGVKRTPNIQLASILLQFSTIFKEYALLLGHAFADTP